MRSDKLLQQVFPDTGIGSSGACFGLSEIAVDLLLIQKSKKLEQLGHELKYGLENRAGEKITASYLEKLLSTIDSSDLGSVKSSTEEIKASLESHLKQKVEEKKVTFADEAVQTFLELVRKHPLINNTTLKPDEASLLKQLATEERRESASDAKELNPPEELKKQMDLVNKIKQALLKKFSPASKEYKEFLAEHDYIVRLSEDEIFLTNVGLLNSPHTLSSKLPGLFAVKPSQITQPSSAWVSPAELEMKGGRTLLTGFTCRYTEATLQTSLDALEVQLKKYIEQMKLVAGEISFALRIASQVHIITLGYDAQKGWFVIDQGNNDSLVQFIKSKEAGKHTLYSVQSAGATLEISGQNFKFFLRYQPLSKKLILANVVESKSDDDKAYNEKMIAELVKSKKLPAINEVCQNLNFNVYTTAHAHESLAPFVREWQQSQVITSDMTKSPDDFDQLPLLHFDCLSVTTTESIDNIMRAGANIDEIDCNGLTALTRACIHNNYQVAIHLLKYHPNPNLGDPTSLAYAVTYNNSELVSALLAAGATITNSRIITEALELGYYKIASLLLAAMQPKDQERFLESIILSKNIEKIFSVASEKDKKQFCERVYNLFYSNILTDEALLYLRVIPREYMLSFINQEKAVDSLPTKQFIMNRFAAICLEEKADLNEKEHGTDQHTFLQLLIDLIDKDPQLGIKLFLNLVSLNVDSHNLDKHKQAVLYHAAKNNYWHYVETFLTLHVDPTMQDTKAPSILELSLQIQQPLLSFGFLSISDLDDDLEVKSPKATPPNTARLDMVKVLLQHGAGFSENFDCVEHLLDTAKDIIRIFDYDMMDLLIDAIKKHQNPSLRSKLLNGLYLIFEKLNLEIDPLQNTGWALRFLKYQEEPAKNIAKQDFNPKLKNE